jgi:hypothetical protein
MTDSRAIEAIVLSAVTSETKASGEVRKVSFLLPNDGGDHPFRGLIGQRIGLVCVKLGEAEHEPPVKAPEPEKERHRFNEMPLAQQCALTCDKPAFAAFLATRGCLWRVETRQAEIEEWVRHYCGVESRRELNTDSHAADRWRRQELVNHRRHPRHRQGGRSRQADPPANDARAARART